MHVLVTVNAAWNLWNFRRPLIEAILDQGHSVTILAPADESVPDLENLGCQFHHLDMNVSGLNPVEDLRLMFRMRHHFRDLRPDIVLSFTIKNNIFGALAVRPLRLAFIPNVTGLGTAFLSGTVMQKIAERLYRTAFRKLAVVFFQNPDDRDLFLERSLVSHTQARQLPGSGIDLQQFSASDYPKDQSAPVFLMIARLLRDKGVFEYVEAARLVRTTHPDAQFQMLGATDVKNRTAVSAEQVHKWQKDGTIEYLGTAKDVRNRIKAAHCVVLPSYREGAPRTLIEAAAMSRPVITTDVPGCREVVDDGTTGFLCNVRSGHSLAASCRKFIALNLPERRRMGENGRKKMVEEYDVKIVTQAYLNAIRDAVQDQ